jgi:hypothetical protein
VFLLCYIILFEKACKLTSLVEMLLRYEILLQYCPVYVVTEVVFNYTSYFI